MNCHQVLADRIEGSEHTPYRIVLVQRRMLKKSVLQLTRTCFKDLVLQV